MSRIIIAGGRDFDNAQMLAEAFQLLSLTGPPEIVSGGARGADRMGEAFARINGYALQIFPADWDKYGKRAGYMRNKTMSDYGEQLLAFWDGYSRGTKNMIDTMRKAGKPTHVVRYVIRR